MLPGCAERRGLLDVVGSQVRVEPRHAPVALALAPVGYPLDVAVVGARDVVPAFAVAAEEDGFVGGTWGCLRVERSDGLGESGPGGGVEAEVAGKLEWIRRSHRM